MRNNISAGSFIEAINASNPNRFTVQADDKSQKYSLLADDENLTDIAVMRLGRLKTGTDYFRTVLISVLNNKTELQIALRWAAEVKRELLDPETSDLYMIIVIPDLPNESCTRIESTEAFCRKFVLRLDESPSELISRTFIAHLSEEESTKEITDPLTEALTRCSSF
jgi:hypothetical protein